HRSQPRRVPTRRSSDLDKAPHAQALYQDWWTGELVAPSGQGTASLEATSTGDPGHKTPRSARLPRRPKARKASDDEDEEKQGVRSEEHTSELQSREKLV